MEPSPMQFWGHFRDLVATLVLRDLKARYRESFLGVAWLLLQPVSLMLVFSFVLQPFVPTQGSDVPYTLFLLTGLIPWAFLSAALTQASYCLVNNTALLKKIYFPREALPLASVLAALVDLIIGAGLILVLMFAVFGGRTPTGPWGPALLGLFTAVTLSLGLALGLSCVLVYLRDARHALPLLSTLWMFATPVVYPLERLPETTRAWLACNPAAYVVESFRSAMLGLPVSTSGWQAVSFSLLTLLAGWLLFRRTGVYLAEIL